MSYSYGGNTTRPAEGRACPSLGRLLEDPHPAELRVALLHKLAGREPGELGEGRGHHVLERPGGGRPVAVGTARRLRDDPVDDAELEEIRGGDPEDLGGVLGAARVLPQNRGAPL